MDQKPVPRKRKFKPKAPPPKRPPNPAVKQEPVETDENSSQAMDLLRRINEGSLLRSKPKVEKKSSASLVAWVGGVANSTRSYSYGSGPSGSSRAGSSGSGRQEDEQYKEPWDYNSNYPFTLPARRPYSGNPERLDEEEFGQDSENAKRYHEDLINAAFELGLTEESVEPRMIFMQLPSLPMAKLTNAGKSASGLKDLPGGLIGRFQVYRSGAVKLKIGDVLYDLNPGAACELAEDVVVIDTSGKECSLVGEVNKRAVLTPDVDSLLDSLDDF